MSYTSERTAGTQQFRVWGGPSGISGPNIVAEFIYNLTGSYSGSRTRGLFDNNNKVKLGNDKYLFKNTTSDTQYYNVYDLVAAAVAAGYDYKKIDAALEDTMNALSNTDVNREALNAYATVKKEAASKNKTPAQYMNQYTVPSIGSIAEELNKQNPALNATIVTKAVPGNGTKYIYELHYTDPTNPDKVYKSVIDADNLGIKSDGSLDPASYNTWLRAQGLEDYFTKNVNNDANTKAGLDLVDEATNILENNPNLGATANTNRGFTQADKAAITAQTPSTDNLQAWNRYKDSDIINTVANNTRTESDLIERKSLEELQSLKDIINQETTGTALRNIDLQRAALLDTIRKDPELYNSIVKQLRTDNAAGTIAGQRAANAGALAQQADAAYDESADKLYEAISGKAAEVRDSAYKNNVDATTQYITGQLDKMTKDARQKQTLADDVSNMADAITAALGVDVQRYTDAVARANAKADSNYSTIASKLSGDVDAELAQQDKKLNTFQDIYNQAVNYLQGAADGSADVTAAVESLKGSLLDYFNSPSSTGSFKTVAAPEQRKFTELENKQYNDAISNEVYQKLFGNADSLTSYASLDQLKEQFGFLRDTNGDGVADLDMLSEQGLQALYEDASKKASEQSNQVFNAAQRAYIAAVTAGDTKTTEQLTRLAGSAGGAKSNLYATSALANQFKQQSGLARTGQQLATDYQNQLSGARAQSAQAASEANTALTNFIGNGGDNYNGSTLYGAADLYDKATSTNRGTFTNLGTKIMDATQKFNTQNSNNWVWNEARGSQLASDITKGNAKSLLQNIINKGTTQTLKAQVDAMGKQYGKK